MFRYNAVLDARFLSWLRANPVLKLRIGSGSTANNKIEQISTLNELSREVMSGFLRKSAS